MPSKQYYIQLKSYAHGLRSVFDSIYLHEKISKMNYLKSHYKLALTDEHLESILMTENTNFEP